MKSGFALPPNFKVEFLHRHCPRCGLDLTQEIPDSVTDEIATNQAKSVSCEGVNSRIASYFEFDVEVDSGLKGMVAPLTQAEKERAQRNEQRWLSDQVGQQAAASQQKNSESGNHQHLIPVVESKFRQWMFHVTNFIRRGEK